MARFGGALVCRRKPSRSLATLGMTLAANATVLPPFPLLRSAPSPFAPLLPPFPPLLLCSLPRVIRRVHVGELPGPDRVYLDDGVPLGLGKVMGARLHRDEAAGRQLAQRGLVELVAHAQLKRSLDHGHPLDSRMEMGRNAVAIGKRHPHGERRRLLGITLEHRGLGSRRE